MNRTDRLLAIVLELQAKGVQRAEDLAATFEISKRTIYRDILALCESGVPVISTPGQGYMLDEGYFLPPLSFTTDEAIVLLLGSDYVAQNFDADYRAAAHHAASKIQTVLPDKLRAEVRELQNSLRFVAFNAVGGALHPDTLAKIRRAIVQRKTIRFDYHTRHTDSNVTGGEKRTRDANPYGLVNWDGAWYMVAYCHLRRDIRHFRLERIDHLTVLDKSFTRPPDFTLVKASESERKVIIRALFDHEVARWVRERIPYFSISEAQTPDGLLVTLAVRQESEIVNWLMSWGSHVRVLEPESLRQKMIEEAERFLEIHKCSESQVSPHP